MSQWLLHRRAVAAGLIRIVLYVAIVLSPVVVITALCPLPEEGFVYTLGLHTGLAGIAILAMQFVLAARFRWVERPFGLDQLFRFHKAMAVYGALLVVAHPVLLAWGSGKWTLLWGWSQPWYIWMGKTALLLLLVTWFVSWFRERIKFEFQKWRLTHNVLAVSLLLLAFLHSIVAGDDLEHPVMRVVWPASLLIVVGVYLFHKAVRPRLLSKHRYQVTEVMPETDNVTTIKLEPPPGKTRFDYLPGQFHFITFHAEAPDVPTEEHHWTISSSPTQGDFLTSTIKASGDFTAKIPKLKVGDTADVLGPYGRFSYLLHPDENDIVMIAGGIGITPLMSMIRHMRDVGSTKRVLLLYANRTEGDIVFRRELDQISQSEHPDLTVVHVLSHADEAWHGPRGLIERDVIAKHCDAPSDKAFYVCAPPPMTDAVTAALLDLGVQPSRIHGERFSL